MEVKGKVVIVTGASSGIGLAVAKLLSRQGAKVVLAARSSHIKNIEKELPDSLAILTDVTQTDDIKNLVKKVMEKYGKIDILINNAGRGMHGFSVEKTPIEEYKEIMELNVFSALELMKEVIPIMRHEGQGMIINISSKLSKMYLPYLGPYSSTKYALNSITQTARAELKKDNIIVSAVLPGMTATNFFKNSVDPKEGYQMRGDIPQADSPEKVAQAILDTIKSEEAEVLV